MQKKSLQKVIEKDRQLKCLPDLIDLAEKYIKPECIILFGSRARGDHVTTSDVDLAFKVSDVNLVKWPRFVSEVDEHLKSLLKFDLIKINSVSSEIKKSIEKEGIVIYEA